MKSLIAVCLMFLALPSSYACDTYNPATNQLTIPIGSMPTTANGTTVFTNAVITVNPGAVVSGGPASHSYDTYTLWTNQLAIPCVQVGNQQFTNVTITVGSVISVGAIYDSPVPPVLDLVTTLPPATVGQAYATNVVAGIFPDSTYTYMIDTLAIGNGVPTGMTLNMNGDLSGTPFATGRTDVNGNQIPYTYTFGVCAVDTISRAMTNPCPQTSIIVNPAMHTLTTSVVGSGTVSASQPGPNYFSGTVVTLTATPTAGSTFSGWSGACTGTGACTVTMNSNVSVTATFAAISALSVTIQSATCNKVSTDAYGSNYQIMASGTVSGAVGAVLSVTPNPTLDSPYSVTCGSWTSAAGSYSCTRGASAAATTAWTSQLGGISTGFTFNFVRGQIQVSARVRQDAGNGYVDSTSVDAIATCN